MEGSGGDNSGVAGLGHHNGGRNKPVRKINVVGSVDVEDSHG